MKKSTSFFLFLIFCFITLSSGQIYIPLEPGKSVTQNLINGNIYQVTLNKDISSYEEYIKIALKSNSDNINPIISISKDDKTCKKK